MWWAPVLCILLTQALAGAADGLGSTANSTALGSTANSTAEEAGGAAAVAAQMSQSSNQEGDLAALCSALLVNALMVVAFLAAFSVLRLRFPKVYAHGVLTGRAPAAPGKCPLAWMPAVLWVSTEEATASAGLDAAMLLEFCSLCMRISGILALPLVFIMCPLHYYCGGGAAGKDRLSSIDMGNVTEGHPWLYYVHAVLVWGVCFVVQWCVHGAQARFLALRFRWLGELPAPRANTVLVEHIPRDCRSDERLREFFARTFSPEAVRDARVARRTGALPRLLAARELQRRELRGAELRRERGAPAPAPRCCRRGAEEGAAAAEARLAELEARISEERARLRREAAAGPGGVNAASGFVTFARRREAEMAQGLRYSADRDKWLVSAAPDAETIIWRDLTLPRWRVVAGRLVGYAVVVAIYIFFTPICAVITSAAKLVHAGPLQPLWAGLVPTIGLQIMLAMMPTLLLLIFDQCFALKAEVWAQHQLQIWYFVFQLVFVVLVSAVGNSLAGSLRDLAEEPLSIFALLAGSLPQATHFFMNYLVLQWASHSMSLLRHANLAKFLLWRALYSEDEARELAEPEDQAFQGCGSRYSRLMTVMAICLVFSTLSPLVAPLSFALFGLCRLVYGYLLVSAETKKSDLGGAFWVTQLKHVQAAAMLYCALMVGVLKGRAADDGPWIIAAPALLFMLCTYVRFNVTFDWTSLPFEEVHRIPEGEAKGGEAPEEVYVQPELLEDGQPPSLGDA